MLCLFGHVKVVKAEDLRQQHDNNTTKTVDDDIESGQQQYSKDADPSNDLDLEENDNKLALPGRTRDGASLVSATCAICLEEYKTGESIAWASNPDCIHCFHQECFVEAFATRPTDADNKISSNLPCPICRQCFLSTETTESTTPSTDTSTKPDTTQV